VLQLGVELDPVAVENHGHVPERIDEQPPFLTGDRLAGDRRVEGVPKGDIPGPQLGGAPRTSIIATTSALERQRVLTTRQLSASAGRPSGDRLTATGAAMASSTTISPMSVTLRVAILHVLANQIGRAAAVGVVGVVRQADSANRDRRYRLGYSPPQAAARAAIGLRRRRPTCRSRRNPSASDTSGPRWSPEQVSPSALLEIRPAARRSASVQLVRLEVLLGRRPETFEIGCARSRTCLLSALPGVGDHPRFQRMGDRKCRGRSSPGRRAW